MNGGSPAAVLGASPNNARALVKDMKGLTLLKHRVCSSQKVGERWYNNTEKNEGLLWERREKLKLRPMFQEEDLLLELPSLDLSYLFAEFDDDYKFALSVDEQNSIVRKMASMKLNAPMGGANDSWNDNLPSEIVCFLDLVCDRLDKEVIPNLFGNVNISPMSNWLTRLLINHKLRSTYDFEVAVSRELNNGNGQQWNFSLINRIGGKDTVVDTVFELKKVGNFGGIKRRSLVKYGKSGLKKCKVEVLTNMTSGVGPKMLTYDASPILKPSISGSQGLNPEEIKTLRIRSKPLKFGRTSPDKLMPLKKKFGMSSAWVGDDTMVGHLNKKEVYESHSVMPVAGDMLVC